MKSAQSASLVAVETFIQATRDSGYKGTASALAEIIDNSLQAGASNVLIDFVKREDADAHPVEVYILDDGIGMDAAQLRQSLRFGGSSRFGDREGLGRYGMGLPNSSLSQARRLEVYTWRADEEPIYSYIDVDEIASRQITEVPEPIERPLPEDLPQEVASESGTLVLWSRCDRLDNKRISTNVRKLSAALGRVFRHFIWGEVQLCINGEALAPVDPLFLETSCQLQEHEDLSEEAREATASIFGEPLCYEVQAPPSSPHPERVGLVTVTFTELPVHAWHDMPNKAKRRLGISKGAGVSIVRGDREIDYGWHFLRGKRRENYDDWWRCEIRFDPVLDEAFGITHTKQQISPMEYLRSLLGPDMKALARALNTRVRKAHIELKARKRFARSERLAEERSAQLPPVETAPSEAEVEALEQLKQRHPSLADDRSSRYRLLEDVSPEEVKGSFFEVARGDGQLVVTLNPDHPFYKVIYKPLVAEKSADAATVRGQLELLLLAAARAAAEGDERERAALARWRERWGETISTFLNE